LFVNVRGMVAGTAASAREGAPKVSNAAESVAEANAQAGHLVCTRTLCLLDVGVQRGGIPRTGIVRFLLRALSGLRPGDVHVNDSLKVGPVQLA
jgi:hypothetical protein